MFAGLSTSFVLLACSLLICRYAWVLYCGKFRSKTAANVEKEPVPCTPDKLTDKETDPEAADGGCIPETQHDVTNQDDLSVSTKNEDTTEVVTENKILEMNKAAVN